MNTDLERRLDKPYFLYRAPDGLGHYFEPQVLRLLTNPAEPISRFLPKARIVRSGEVPVVRYSLPQRLLRTIKPWQCLPRREIHAFEQAAKAFYAGSKKSTKYEMGLRRRFRLPDPDKDPDAFRVHGSTRNPKLVVLWGVERVPDTSIPMVALPGDEASAGNTVASKLKKRPAPIAKRFVGYSMGIAACLSALLYAFLAKDTSPPEISEIQAVNDPVRMVVRFDEELDPNSLNQETFKIRNTALVLTPEIHRDDASQVTLTLSEPLSDDRRYVLDFGLSARPRDLAGNTIQNEYLRASEADREFRYEDTLPPRVARIEPMPPRGIRVAFNEPLASRSAQRRSAYRIEGFHLEEALLLPNQREVELTFEEPLVHNGSYVLEMEGVEDGSLNHNPLLGRSEFRYVDTSPPDLVSVAGGGNQAELIVVFDEPVDPVTALSVGNYALSDGLEIRLATPYVPGIDLETGEQLFSAVRLVTTPMTPHKAFDLSVSGVGDLMQPSNRMQSVTRPCAYLGSMDRNPPFIRKVKGSRNLATIEFSEILDHDCLKNVSFAVTDLKRMQIIEVGAVSSTVVDGVTRADLQLKGKQYPGRLYHLVMQDCTDASGNLAKVESTYLGRGVFKEPISLQVTRSPSIGDVSITLNLPQGVHWNKKSAPSFEAYGVATLNGGSVAVDTIEYDEVGGRGQVRLALSQPLGEGVHQFFIEGVSLTDGTQVDRPYQVRFDLGSLLSKSSRSFGE